MNTVLDMCVTPAQVAAPTLVGMVRAVVAFATEMQRTLVPPLCFEAGDIFLLPTDGAVERGEERDAGTGLGVLARTLYKFNKHPLAEILGILQNEIGRPGAGDDDRTILLLRALSRSGNHKEPGGRRQPVNDSTCRELLEAGWHKMLAGLAASLTDH